MNELNTDAIRVWAQKADELWKGPNLRPFSQEEANLWTKVLYMEKLHPEFNSDPQVLADLEKPAWQGDCILWRRIKAWDNQKGFDHRGDIPKEINLLDNPEYYETIKDLPDNKYKSIMPF